VGIQELKDNYYDLREQGLLLDCDGGLFIALSVSGCPDTICNAGRSHKTYMKAMPNPD